MQNHILLKSGEVENLRFLSKCVIQQRMKVNSFFLETLDYIKNATITMNKENSKYRSSTVERTQPSTNHER